MFLIIGPTRLCQDVDSMMVIKWKGQDKQKKPVLNF